MSFGKNLQSLRKMHHGMTQEELAEKLNVSRQTVSKWELDGAYPEMDKLLALCDLFSCSMDKLVREDMNASNEAYSNIRMEEVESFCYIRYAVVSAEPEIDALNHVKEIALQCGVREPQLIGWDFPVLSQEQINVFHMHGYAAAWILPENREVKCAEVIAQDTHKYMAITIKEPFAAPFDRIPNAYKTLMSYMQANGIEMKYDNEVLPCFEKEYNREGTTYMDVYIAVK